MMKENNEILVSVAMGSDSDAPIMAEAVNVLREFEIPYEVYLTSAHRAPPHRSTCRAARS